MSVRALEGPSLRYSRVDEPLGEPPVARALRLAREVEELLAENASERAPVDQTRVHSTRMARAMAASLVDELEALVRSMRADASLPGARPAAARKTGNA